MKVITGKYRGRVINAPEGMNTRPTLQRAKETMFNMSLQTISGGKGVDVFSGSGQLGIEALSRGLDFCYFNEIDQSSLKTLKSNLAKVEENSFRIFSCDYKALMNQLTNTKLDVVFVDPPYPIAKEAIDYIIKFLDDNNLMNEGGIITGEIPTDVTLPEFELKNLKLKKVKNYSKLTNIFVFTR